MVREAILTLGPDRVTNTVEVSIGQALVTFNAEGVSPYQIASLQAHTRTVFGGIFTGWDDARFRVRG